MDNLYMRIDDIKGQEPIGDDPMDLIKIISYRHALLMPIAPFRPSVGMHARLRRSYCEHGLFTVTKGFDKTSPKLFEACANGVVFPTVLIHLCITKGKGAKLKEREMDPMLTIVMTDAVMASFDYGFAGEWPIETIEFRYTSIGWKTTWVDPKDGKEEFLSPVGWNGGTNKGEDIEIEKELKWGAPKSLKLP
jgi:type VI secretion system secreted protein Hcp